MIPRCELVADLYMHSPSTKPPLRLGLFTDTSCLNRAAASVVRDIEKSDFARIELLVCNARSNRVSLAPERSYGRSKRTHLQEHSGLLWRLYTRLDTPVDLTESDPLAKETCRSVLDNVDRLTVTIEDGASQQLRPEALAAITAKDLDVLLQLGFTGNHLTIPHAAKFGMWSLHYGDYECYRGEPAYFWELYEQNLLSGLTLLLFSQQGDCQILAKALFPTQLGLSVRRNAVRPFWGSSQLVMQKLWELHAYGWDFVRRRIAPSRQYSGKRENYRSPTNSEIVHWFAPQATTKLCSRIRQALTGSEMALHWQIAIRVGNRSIFRSDGTPEIDGFRWLESPRGHFYADPFVVDRDGQHWLFFEDYDYQRKRGSIVCVEVSSSGGIGQVQTVLESPHHLSYPYVFANDGSLYMIPESGSERVVRLYRCVEFPLRWVPVVDLFQGPAFDTSVCRSDGLWWFFTTLQDPRGQGIALYLFSSESLTGDWQYHPANPISRDARNARCAGRLFKIDDRFIRPSQNSTIRYGYSFTFNEIVTLSPSEYEERPILTVEPGSLGDLLATHTYNRGGSIEAVDGQRRMRKSQL